MIDSFYYVRAKVNHIVVIAKEVMTMTGSSLIDLEGFVKRGVW